MSRALMIVGTGSGAGKSLIVAAFCRIFRDMGISVAPFKAQNMALNSSITTDGSEIGRAQALQAEAAGIAPTVDMNPILLKASGEKGSQVIIQGRVHSMMKAQEYYAFKKEAWKAVKESYGRLSRAYDLIVMEGAGSPAEINLMSVDIVNIAAAKHAKAPVLLVGDIDKGGVFASLYGTVKLLGRDSRHIKGYVINKFRGDLAILEPGLDMIREKTGKPVIGVLPYIHDMGLPEEDGLALQQHSKLSTQNSKQGIKVVIVKFQYISNFTDFDPFLCEPDVAIAYSSEPAEIENADLVIIPGSKNTVKDLLFLKKHGLDRSIRKAYEKGVQIVGTCGGYQMLGKKIYDPLGVESHHGEMDGLGILNIETTFDKEKTTCQVEAEITGTRDWGFEISEADTNPQHLTPNPFIDPQHLTSNALKGYEIHMGVSRGDIGLFRLKRLSSHSALNTQHSEPLLDGSMNRNCWGTYLHGIFENDSFRQAILNQIRERKGLAKVNTSQSYTGSKEKALNRLAGVVAHHIDMEFVKGILKL
ncbi:MAG TPA: cobyric acid synthase [Thermodesulfovibrionales bacterium]|nr:cobyric acid synthase [Thermodesulfovibrionales bacterium]